MRGIRRGKQQVCTSADKTLGECLLKRRLIPTGERVRMSLEAKKGLKCSELSADVNRLLGGCQRRLEQENIFVLGCDAA